MKKMNYNEFKAAICANCKDWEPAFTCACNYNCEFPETYEKYLTLLDEIDTLESECKELIDLAEWGEEEAKEFEEEHPGESGDVFRRIAKRHRYKAAALLPVICKRKEKIAQLMAYYNVILNN